MLDSEDNVVCHAQTASQRTQARQAVQTRGGVGCFVLIQQCVLLWLEFIKYVFLLFFVFNI